MKYLMILVALATLSIARVNAGWFGNDQANQQQQEQINHLNDQLQHEQTSKGNWQVVAFGLGITSCVMLMVGAAVGSKGRRNAGQ